ncbi:MAG: SpoIIE family protein phosphatase [Vicinamibacteria bacterium]|nr:SpoIIE family protein phosphatase [Vicinamibacteria bacterium]
MKTGEDEAGAVRRLNSLLEVSMALAGEVDLDPLLSVILAKATDVMEAETSTIFLYDEDAEVLRSHVSGQLARDAVTLKLGVGIAGQVAKTLAVANVPDAYADPRFNPRYDRDTGFRTRNILCGPLQSRDGRLLGVVQLLNKKGRSGFSTDDQALLLAFASIAGVAIDRARLVEAAVESKRIEESLRLAHDIQMGMLTRRFPSQGVAMHADLEPARAVGGDFYDLLEQDGRVWFTVGDVSGKGMGAALFMAITLTLFRASAEGASSPAEVMSRMNRTLSRDNQRSMFVTVFIALLDIETGRVTFANGGHNPPYVLRESGVLECLSYAASPALGVFEDAVYANSDLALLPGDGMLLYTDGVTEAKAPNESFYGEARLEARLRGLAESPPADWVGGIMADVAAFAAGAPPADDLTLLALRRPRG